MAPTVRALTWNLYHGRDHPPDPALFSRRSRLLRRSERNATHVQVNRPLRRLFADTLDSLAWDFALLQEAPPRWLRPLCRELGAAGASALTSRNFGSALRAIAADLNPDLLASSEGGSNQLLVRPPWSIEDVRRRTLTWWPERRRMLWARVSSPGGGLAIANLHASVDRHDPEADVLRAAETAVAWSGDLPLVFGGDLNVRPAEQPGVFDELERRFGLAGATAPDAIDHLLSRGLEVVERPHRLPDAAREQPQADGLLVRLSDHSPVAGAWGLCASDAPPSRVR